MALTLTAIPVVTLGAGLAAANVVAGQLVAEDGAHPWRTFWRVFSRSLRIATPGWLALLAVGFAVVYELMLLRAESGMIVDAMRIGLISAAILAALVAQWFFALAGHAAIRRPTSGARPSETGAAVLVEEKRVTRAPASLGEIAQAAMFAAIRYLPLSALGLASWLAPLLAAWWWPAAVPTLIFFTLVFIPAFVIYVKTLAIGQLVREITQLP